MTNSVNFCPNQVSFPQSTVHVLQQIKKEYEEKSSDMSKICTETNQDP